MCKTLETFILEDMDVDDDDTMLLSNLKYSQKLETPESVFVLFFTKKLSIVIFIECGKPSPDDKMIKVLTVRHSC